MFILLARNSDNLASLKQVRVDGEVGPYFLV